MFFNRVFRVALIVSAAVHGAIFLQNPNFSLFSKKEQKQETQINYIQPAEPKTKIKKTLPARQKEYLLNKLPSKITAEEKKLLPAAVDKKDLFAEKKNMSFKRMGFPKPILKKPDTIAVKKKITLPPINTDKINSPSYISYYQIVREKIKRAAYQNYAGEETGEVVVSFVISKTGELKKLHLAQDKSSSSDYLKETALTSLKDASPFPAFPEELNYPQLSFNLAITFETE